MKTYYCGKDFKPGMTCTNCTSDGRCNGGWFSDCSWKSTTPKLRSMVSVKQPKRESTNCNYCEHRITCSLKKKFNKLKADNYPLVCECQYYKSRNPLLEV